MTRVQEFAVPEEAGNPRILKMQPDDLAGGNEVLRDGLAGLSEVSLRINGSPNFDTVLFELRDHCSLFGVATPELRSEDLLS